jgi:class 3 adenylate cyclase
MTRAVIEPLPYAIVGLFAIGMALCFFEADRRAPTSRAFALMLGLLGVIALLNIPAYVEYFGLPMPVWIRIFSLLEAGILIAGLEWILRIGRTAGAGEARGDLLVRIAQVSGLVYGVLGTVLPELRERVWAGPQGAFNFGDPSHWIFGGPFLFALGLGTARIVQLLRAGIERAELVRLLALAAATPLWYLALVLPPGSSPLAIACGEIVVLAGAIRYHVMQGQRGEFIARFLSPQVVRLVQERGFARALRRTRREISVVACDLRGFTAFAESAPPEEVIQVLEAYYDAVGQVVARHGGSIKDFAGDGILALVGAPIPVPDHASRAVAMALEIRDRSVALLARWTRLGHDVGVGVGVATGFATVGVIGGSGRLEYAAVGPAVNLAARLATHAAADQVLVEPRVVAAASDDGGAGRAVTFVPREPVELKGVPRPVAVHEAHGQRDV